MDRNSAIGLSLIALIFIVYIYFLAPASPPSEEPATTSSVPADTIRQQAPVGADSSLIKSYGHLGTALAGEQSTKAIESEDLAITFSNHGTINSVELRKFKTYYQKPLFLAQPSDNKFQLTGLVDGRQVDLYKLIYQENATSVGDTTVITYSANIGASASVKHVYKVPKTGFIIGYQLQTSGLNISNTKFTWSNNIPLQEMKPDDSRIRTTTNWYSSVDGFDNISETSQDIENEAVATPLQWASFRQKFFVSAIMAKKPFSSGEFSTRVNVADTSHVKDAQLALAIADADIKDKTSEYQYYFGPNDFRLLADVKAESFQRNVYLGWPPVKWVNQFIILPIFHFLELAFSNYGVIIMILVLIIRLILTPLTYSSYLGMAKMRLLKPELDVIKKKNGENMAQTQQDQMKLYREAGVNPFSGCIPLLLQMPILLAMFYFFPISIEFRQEPFLWAQDLSTYDSILNLPFSIPGYGDHVSLFVLLMTASTLISTWQNNQMSSPEGPMKTLSYVMPVIFLFILNNFSAGLSFYYFVSNVFGFLQQLLIRRFVDEGKIMNVMEAHKKKMLSEAPAGGGTGKKSKFMARLEEAMKASEEAKKKNQRK